jgi:hypothetical protein
VNAVHLPPRFFCAAFIRKGYRFHLAVRGGIAGVLPGKSNLTTVEKIEKQRYIIKQQV